MSENDQSETFADVQAIVEVAENVAAPEFGSLAAFADAESREILNLLNQDSGDDNDAAGGCCGGSCCS